ncbi:MAG: hypothetical protein PHF60_00170 [Candidatus ainarchaeum sp.]|nr:hypothetical protein [Candidatus ainarchaeum sp.]
MKSGRKQESNQEKFHKLARWWDGTATPFARSWESAKNLFYHDKVASTLDGALKRADARHTAYIFALAALMTFIISVIATLESLEITKYTVDILEEISGTTLQTDFGNLGALIVFQYTTVPITLVFIAIHELLVYRIARLTGGKGTFGQQFYLSSLVSLAMAFLSALYLFMALPCIGILALLGLVIGSAYLVLYVSPKAYARVHGISYVHAFAINIVLLILRMAALYFISNAMAGLLGIQLVGGSF